MADPRITNLAESSEYTAARADLQQAEIALMRQREQVAELRRHLPVGAALPEYVLQEGPADLAGGDTPVRDVRLSELFTADDRPLVVYHLMYGKRQTSPCPMCTLWVDGFNGVAPTLAQTVDFAVVAAAEPTELRGYARERGWSRLRLLSAGDSTFMYDLGAEDAEGNPDSTVSVFTRDPDGTVRHRYSTHPRMSTDIDQRGIDLFNPVWHLLDLTPAGRGDWYAGIDSEG